MKCGLLGRKLAHSYSPQIHALFAEYSYVLIEKEPDELSDFLKNGDFSGLNVTMPYKKDVIPYLDQLTPLAQRLGAVNTIIRQDGKLMGHNTDYAGFLSMIQKCGISPAGKHCLVLGSGGASHTAVAVLQDLGARVTVISRTGKNNYENLHKHQDAAILVNATPVGMYPNTGISPVELDLFPLLEAVLDVVYNPARTQLLMDAQARGLITENGLWMLIAQAKEAAESFTGKAIPNSQIRAVYTEMKQAMENIVLIGMPGCGKSTIGKLLATKTGRVFVDTDAEIEILAQKSIPAIFAQDGENAFRSLETQVLDHFGKRSGLVIATGGGCVTRQENYPLLHQNGTIFWLQRDLRLLPTANRPLSQSQGLENLLETRRVMYARFADRIIDNNRHIDATVNAIWEDPLCEF